MASDLQVYRETFSQFEILNITNPVKLFQWFLENQNELLYLRRENREITRENITLRNHFTNWYVAESRKMRITESEHEMKRISKTCIFLEPEFQDNYTQTETVVTPPPPNKTEEKISPSANITIRLEIVSRSGTSSQHPDIKILNVNSPSSVSHSILKLKSDAGMTSDEAYTDCEESEIDEGNTKVNSSNGGKSCETMAGRHHPKAQFASPVALEDTPEKKLETSNPNSANDACNFTPVQVCKKRKKSLRNMFSRSKHSVVDNVGVIALPGINPKEKLIPPNSQTEISNLTSDNSEKRTQLLASGKDKTDVNKSAISTRSKLRKPKNSRLSNVD